MERRDFLSAALVVAAGVTVASPAAALSHIDHFRAVEWRAARRFVPTRFGSIACVERGRGDAALFLHGYPLSGFQWRGAIEQLELDYRCIAPDFLGLGATEAAPGQALDAASQAAMIVALLDALGVERAHVVASDSGIAVAQLLAVGHPGRIRSLILTNGDTERQSPPPAMLPVIDLARRGEYAERWLAPWLADHDRARSEFGRLCYTEHDNPSDAAIEMYFAPLLATPARRRQVEAHAVAQARNALTGITARLRTCQVPARILWGMADTIFDAANADELDNAFGKSRGVRRLDGAKLFWPEERPGVIAEEAHTLWRSLRS